MKKFIIPLVLFALAAVSVISFYLVAHRLRHPEEALVAGSSVTVSGLDICFSPKGGCEAKIIEFIKAENKEILVQAYSFTNKDIADALITKAPIVHVLMDRSTISEPMVKYLSEHGVDVLIDKKHPIAHNKLIITPGAVETGSYNYTNQAEDHNAENAIFIKHKPTAQKYRDNWMLHKAHSISPTADSGTAGTTSVE
jgi:phosphatidylserine/phosphatidylglycerophosphate/cardiolipin synthase-like enzyme